jgi:acyl carrier protein
MFPTPVADRIVRALAKELRREPGTIRLTDSFRDDLGLNSLDAVELIFRVEEAFDLMIPDEDVSRLTTVGHIVEYVEKRLSPAGEPGSKPGPVRQTPVTGGTRRVRASASRRAKSKKG